MCAIYSLRIILLVNNICVRNFRRFGWNENFLTMKISRITVHGRGERERDRKRERERERERERKKGREERERGWSIVQYNAYTYHVVWHISN